jgi:hypothetical protein
VRDVAMLSINLPHSGKPRRCAIRL